MPDDPDTLSIFAAGFSCKRLRMQKLIKVKGWPVAIQDVMKDQLRSLSRMNNDFQQLKRAMADEIVMNLVV